MLVSHAAFLSQASETAAVRLKDGFVIAANSLEDMPQRCAFLYHDYIRRANTVN